MYDPNHINNARSGFNRFSTEELLKALEWNLEFRHCAPYIRAKARAIIRVLKKRRNALF